MNWCNAYARAMHGRSLAVALMAPLAFSSAAFAAAKTGLYSGTSVNTGIEQYGSEELKTDKGKLTFTVKKSAIYKFKLSGQQIMCGASPQTIPMSVSRIKLSSTGRGKATYTDPNVGAFKIAIKVTATGRASGTITPTGLCRGVVKFTAKRR